MVAGTVEAPCQVTVNCIPITECNYIPARPQDLVLWFEPWSYNGGIWRNLAPNYTDRYHGIKRDDVGRFTWYPRSPPALQFYAEDEKIDLPLEVLFDDEMTIEIVFTLYDSTDYGRVLGSEHSAGNKSEIRSYTAPGKHFLGVSNGSSTYYVWFKLDFFEKVHGTWTWQYDSSADETTFKGYKNGEYADVQVFSGKVILPNQRLTLGHWRTLGMRGEIYLARFYHRVLSEPEIAYNYTHSPIYYVTHGIGNYETLTRRV